MYQLVTLFSHSKIILFLTHSGASKSVIVVQNMMRLVFPRGSVLLLADISLFLLLSLQFYDKFEDNFSLISRH